VTWKRCSGRRLSALVAWRCFTSALNVQDVKNLLYNKKGRMGGREVFVEFEKFSEFMVIKELCRCGCWDAV